MVFQKQG